MKKINFHDYKIVFSKKLKFNHKINSDYFNKKLRHNFKDDFKSYFKKFDLKYRFLDKNELQQHFYNYLNYIHSDVIPSGPKRNLDWEIGWMQNYKDITKNNISEKFLLPHYYKRGKNIMRFSNEFIFPRNDEFENSIRKIILKGLSLKYFKNVDNIYEFGAGPCHNIFTLSQFNENKSFYALDWASPSQKIIKYIENNKKNFKSNNNYFFSKKFDFFKPDYSFTPKENSIIFTFGGLEQVGTKYKNILNYFLSLNKVKIIHIEPFVELYDINNLMGLMGYEYSKKRNYLHGYLKSLNALKINKKIKISNISKILGSGFHDGWTLVVWTKS